VTFGERSRGAAKGRAGSARSEAKKPRVPNVTKLGLEGSALRYLERFDCTVGKLRQVLNARVRSAAKAGSEHAVAAPAIIEELLVRYQSSGLINDERFAQNFSARQRDRGASQRMIEMKLRARNVPAEVVSSLFPRGESRASELEAAQAFAKRRRLGPHRKAEDRQAYANKDLQALARAGFDFDTAKRVVGHAAADDDF